MRCASLAGRAQHGEGELDGGGGRRVLGASLGESPSCHHSLLLRGKFGEGSGLAFGQGLLRTLVHILHHGDSVDHLEGSTRRHLPPLAAVKLKGLMAGAVEAVVWEATIQVCRVAAEKKMPRMPSSASEGRGPLL